ncbi:hypothetical protein [Leifsonia sp. fls2-241-R2A-40a]|uniref:hypothetical protein n=1 Tax=Leifsonia sp. fls2-241-R2A-40a TaxID=3040290 RepID=UPI00254B6A47|nr:hypothetical protein [Leifsonia sp. fls2-241-R2A-40a]
MRLSTRQGDVPGVLSYDSVEERFRVDCAQGDLYDLRRAGDFTFKVRGTRAAARGYVAIRHGVHFLALHELRVGTDSLQEELQSLRLAIENASLAFSYRFDDGAAVGQIEIPLPAIDEAPPAKLTLENGDLVITPADGALLAALLPHVAALEDLITFCCNKPSAVQAVTGMTTTGREIAILGQTRYLPFRKPAPKVYDLAMRLGNARAPQLFAWWWEARTEARPVTQILAGTLYQGGFVESGAIALLAAAEVWSRNAFEIQGAAPFTDRQLAPIVKALQAIPDMDKAQKSFVRRVRRNKPADTTLGDHLRAMLDDLGDHVSEARIARDVLVTLALRARNQIAHEGAPRGQGAKDAMTDAELRAVRDATRLLLTLSVCKAAGVPAAALSLTGRQLGSRYAQAHKQSGIFL